MPALAETLDEVAAATGFAGVVRVDTPGGTLALAYGLAHRSHGLPMTVDSRLGIASGSKAMTALAVMSLVGDGLLDLSTPVRAVLGPDLPLIGADVTVEHLLSHRSGIGDYLDEDVLTDADAYVLPVSAHELATTGQYLGLLDGRPAKFPAGERFSYCNSAYVVLALLAERISGRDFHSLVHERVLAPAGMVDSGYFRSDCLPGRTALGYVPDGDGGWRTNVFHLPVRGNGDGGLYSTAADVHRFWDALAGGRIGPPATMAEMTRPRSATSPGRGYGLGFWLDTERDAVELKGCDAGVSFRSHSEPVRSLTWTVLGSTSTGAWPLAAAVEEHLNAEGRPLR